MRMLALAASFFVSLSLAQADEVTDLVDRAIQAHGGAERLAKLKTLSESAKGTIHTAGSELPATREAYYELPERLRWDVEMTPAQRRIEAVLVVGPQRGWRRSSGQTEEMTNQEWSDIREEAHAYWLTTLLPLRGDSLTLTGLPPTTLDRKPARGIRVVSKGKPDVFLFFDTASGLLVKMAVRCHEAGLTVTKEHLYADHKPFDGVMLPTKVTSLTNSRKVAEFTITGYRFGSIDAAKFGRP